jgi:hypothetical protein
MAVVGGIAVVGVGSWEGGLGSGTGSTAWVPQGWAPAATAAGSSATVGGPDSVKVSTTVGSSAPAPLAASEAPQEPQKRLSAGFWWPQFGQSMSPSNRRGAIGARR